MKKRSKKVSRSKSYRKSSQPKWFKRLLAFFVVVVLISGFGILCISFAHSASAVLGAHIVITTK